MPAAARSPARLEPRCCTIMPRNTSVSGRLTSIVITQTPSRIIGARVARRMPSIHAETAVIGLEFAFVSFVFLVSLVPLVPLTTRSYEKRPRQQAILQPDHPLHRPFRCGRRA